MSTGFMDPTQWLKAPTRAKLVRLAKLEVAAGIKRKGCGKIQTSYDWHYERCECGGTLPKGERAAENCDQ